MKPIVWALTRTEYAGQCTGFGSETTWLVIFSAKPDMKTLAPFIGSHLSSDMGVAIAEVQTLIDKLEVSLKNDDFSLLQVTLDASISQ